MQTLNVRELRNTIPHLRATLEREHEILLVSNGEPVARILPIQRKQKLESMADFRAQMPFSGISSEQIVREDRDRRGS